MKYTLLALVAMTGVASAATLSVNFTGSTSTSVSGTAFGVAAADWNNAGGSSDGGGGLVVTADNAQTANLTYSAGGAWRMAGTPAAGDETVQKGYLDDATGGVGVTTTITLDMSSIATGPYTVTVYSASDDGATTAFGWQDVTVNSTTTSLTDLGSTTNLGNHSAVTVFAGETGDLTISSAGRAGSVRGSIAGFKVDFTPIPEPSSSALLGLGGLALILRRRK